ncbi:MAG: peptidoglycan DD-metalloendopeptidase family protein [Sulfuricella denitrificans]|nr:peptidoglycan DD-metalloendopeptidase family protein [Sulfuricella denitrificans]
MTPEIRIILRTVALALACLITHAHAAPKPELQELRGRIDTLKKSLDSTEDAKADAADELKASEQSISSSNNTLRDLARQQQAAQSALNALEQEKTGLDKRISAEQIMLGHLFYQQYHSGQQDQFKILLNQENPSQAARQLRYYTYLARARSELLEHLRDNLVKLEKLALETKTKQAELSKIRIEQDRQRQKLLEQQQTKKKLVTQLSKQIGQQRSELSRLQRNEKQLTQLIERLARQQREAPKKTPAPSSSARNSIVPDASIAGISFPQLKGKLQLPVRGELTGRFGTPRQDSGSPWRGLFIRTAATQEVHAIASGRVVFADWLRGFGNLLIVDHGSGYMSLYGNNESIFKRTGEAVRAGDVIASTGNSGGNPETGLYFEIRYQSKPFDPLDWCKIS